MSSRKEFIQKIAKIQKEIKCGKTQFNKFGNFYHRNIEDIMEALKPFLGELMVKVEDEMVMVGERYYVKSTASITDGEFTESTTAFAREPESAKGLSDGQLSGASSSYASKYALGKLLLLDDNKDMDSSELTELDKKTKTESKPSKFTRNKDKPKVVVTEKEEEVTPVEESEKNEGVEEEKPVRRVFRRNK